MHNYPTINFIGNKRQLTSWISELCPIEAGSVLDLFSGGGSVSYMLKDKGLEVLSNDCLFSNFILSKAFVENNQTKLSESVFDIEPSNQEYEAALKKVSFLSSKLYFDYEIPELAKLVAISSELNGYEYYIYLSLLRRAMIRKLPYSRMNISWEKIVQLRDENYSYNMYGRKRAYHNEPFINHMRSELANYNNAIFSNGRTCKSFQMDAVEISRNIDYVDVVYMDPPYPSTLNNYDSFYGYFDDIFDKRYVDKTDFTSKKTFCNNMRMVLDNLKDKTKYIMLSINTHVIPSHQEMASMLSEYGTCKIYSKNHNYQLTGKTNKNSSKELIILVKL